MNGVGGNPQTVVRRSWKDFSRKVCHRQVRGGGAASMDSAGAYAGMLAAVCTWPRQPAVRSVLGRWGGGVGRRVWATPAEPVGFGGKKKDFFFLIGLAV